MSQLPEQAFFIDCEGQELPAILHPGEASARSGVVIIVGGPQYRVGSHRQFVLLARDLAAAGIPALRFDYRGMGDADGEPRNFEQVDADIRAAVDALIAQQPAVQNVMLWGLCDAASAALTYAPNDPRISALMLLNPWLPETKAKAKVVLKHYYWQRLRSKDFWRKLFGGGVKVFAAAKGVSDSVKQTRQSSAQEGDLSGRMASAWRAFGGNIALILSGDDLVAQEFFTVAADDKRWQGLLQKPTVQTHRLPEANHTFSRRQWRDEVSAICRRFIAESKQN